MEDFNFYLRLFTDCYSGQYKKSINKNNEITVGKNIQNNYLRKHLVTNIYYVRQQVSERLDENTLSGRLKTSLEKYSNIKCI